MFRTFGLFRDLSVVMYATLKASQKNVFFCIMNNINLVNILNISLLMKQVSYNPYYVQML